MATFPLDGFDGYTSKTFIFKTDPDGNSIHTDVVYPTQAADSPSTVLVHYHGGFLVFGDRYSFLPYWLVHASVARNWIFVTPEYRLIPESTAHASVEDAVDAYKWVRSSLSGLLERPIGSVLVAGSSAGGYLALTTTTIVAEKPDALLLVYGMLDAAGPTYTTPGPNIFGQPTIETGPILREFPITKEDDDRKKLSAYKMTPDMAADPRSSLVSALHVDGIFVDYMTGVAGLARAISTQGAEAIADRDRHLFPLTFANLAGMPKTFLLHGVNDSGVPVSCSKKAAEKLRAAGVEVVEEFPVDAEHGFDVRAGNINVESTESDGLNAVESLRNAVQFLSSSVAAMAQGQNRPASAASELERLSPTDQQKVEEVAIKMMQSSTEEQKNVAREVLHQRFSQAQIQEIQSHGKDPLILFYQDHAYNTLKANIARQQQQ
ncbi:hypothetical protein V2G26_010516 [Clonostachys chloroleuca]|uniref:Alpha/beta hydrolase fold-3 domain-containing protein n=1 Tax=Clonostachys chloroleuca TaxID=1926264 RepID=A0AA35VKZ4_9HYPO|nr:unnamed protein product [Clonostachys chloroleuca]